MRARIAATATETFQARARILATVDRTIDMRAHIRNKTTRDLEMRSRISRQQGWPIMSPFDPGFSLFQPTQLNMRARIVQGVRTAQTIDMRANIRRGDTSLLLMRARIVIAASISMRARIKPRRLQTRASMTYYVARAGQARALMLFYTQGNVIEQSISMRARIVKAQQTRVTGTFVVHSTTSGATVLGFNFDSNERTLQQIRMGARIKAP